MNFEKYLDNCVAFKSTDQEDNHENIFATYVGNEAPTEENEKLENILDASRFRIPSEIDAEIKEMEKEHFGSLPINISVPETSQSDERKSFNEDGDNQQQFPENAFLVTLDVANKLSDELGEPICCFQVENEVEIETDNTLFAKELDKSQEFEIGEPSFKRTENLSVSSEDSPVQKKRKVEDGNIMKIPDKDKKSFKKSQVGTEKKLKKKYLKSKLQFKKNEFSNNAKENVPDVKSKAIGASPDLGEPTFCLQDGNEVEIETDDTLLAKVLDCEVFQNTDQDSTYENFSDTHLGNEASIEENGKLESILVEELFHNSPKNDAQFDEMVREYLIAMDISVSETAQSDERASFNYHNENQQNVSEDEFLLFLDVDKILRRELGELAVCLQVGNEVELETDGISGINELQEPSPSLSKSLAVFEESENLSFGKTFSDNIDEGNSNYGNDLKISKESFDVQETPSTRNGGTSQEFEMGATSVKRTENHLVSSTYSTVPKKRKVEEENDMKISDKDKKSFQKSQVGTGTKQKTKNRKSTLDPEKEELRKNGKENVPEVKTKAIEVPPKSPQTTISKEQRTLTAESIEDVLTTHTEINEKSLLKDSNIIKTTVKKNIEGQYNLQKPEDSKKTASESSHESFTTLLPCIVPSLEVIRKTTPSPGSVNPASSEASNKTKSQCIASKILKRITYDYSKLLLAWCPGKTSPENTIRSLLTDPTAAATMVTKRYSFSGWGSNNDMSGALVLKFMTAKEAMTAHRTIVFRSRESVKTLPVCDLLKFTAKLESSHSTIASSSMTITTKNITNQSTAKDLELCAMQYGDIKSVQHLTERQLDIKFACVTQGILALIALDNTYLSQMGHLSTTMKQLSGNKVIIPEVLKFIEDY